MHVYRGGVIFQKLYPRNFTLLLTVSFVNEQMVMIIALQQLEPDITLEGISTVMYIFNFEYTFAFHEKTPKSWHKRVELLWIFHESKGCKNT